MMRPAHVFAFACFACALWPQQVLAQELVAGWEGEQARGYTFVSSSFSVAGTDRCAVILRPAVSFLYYDIGMPEQREHVRSPGAALSVGVRFTNPRVSFTVTPGIEIRRTTRAQLSGAQVAIEQGATLQGELFLNATARTVFSVLGSYGRANRYTWARAAMMRRVKQGGRLGIGIGAEGTLQGNADFQTVQVGIAVEIVRAGPTLSIQARTGYARHSDEAPRLSGHPYFGVGLYRRF